MGRCRKSQRLSFWSHYGRLKHHMQACDQLLDRINACAGLPGRPKINVPASISRKVPIKCMPGLHCKTPPHISPSTPFEACLNLSFKSDCLAQPNKLPSEDLEPCKPLTPDIESHLEQDTSPQNSEIPSYPEMDGSIISSETPESHDHDQRIDISTPSLDLWPVKSTSSEITELPSRQESSHIVSNSNLNTQSGHICCKNTTVPTPPPVECSYYHSSVLSSNQKIYITSSAVRHTAYCRLETFVIRSRSIRSPVLQQRK